MVAAMTLPNVLDRMEEGAVVVTPGDRPEIVLGVLFAHVSPDFPQISGIVLSGGVRLPEQIEPADRRAQRLHADHLDRARDLRDGERAVQPARAAEQGVAAEGRARPWRCSGSTWTARRSSTGSRWLAPRR